MSLHTPLFVVCLTIFSSFQATSQTENHGGILSGVRALNGSAYPVAADVAIPEGSTLKVDKVVTIQSEEGEDLLIYDRTSRTGKFDAEEFSKRIEKAFQLPNDINVNYHQVLKKFYRKAENTGQAYRLQIEDYLEGFNRKGD